ncbi:MAG TPA: hypothetical protein GX513_08740 [Firmicutes bacterium]|nr:hypothetical protein [Bacillota bacterium]
MKLPKMVTIGGHCFTVELVDVVNKHVPRRGEIQHLDVRIRIDRTMAHSRQEESLLHECLHEIDQQLALGLGEEVISRLSEALYAAIKVNRLYFGLDDDQAGEE